MLTKIRERAQSEKGFTLIELLVVILIIGILAAIALPAFLGQKTKAEDSAAKSDARNMVSQLESYYVDHDTYAVAAADADAASATTPKDTGLPVGTTAGKVAVTAGNTNTFTIVAESKSGDTFTIKKVANGVIERDCAVPAGNNNGGCKDPANATAGW